MPLGINLEIAARGWYSFACLPLGENPALRPKKIYIKTYGCQMNFYDSGRMHDLMKPQGFEVADTVADADLVILNTCHIREKAVDKVYSELGRIRQEKEKMAASGRRMVIAVAGCVAQAEGEEIRRRAPYVDIVVGPQSFQRLPELVANANESAGAGASLDFATVEKFDRLPEESAPQGASAFLTVQEGCDKFCTYCVVPYTRGVEFSRPVAEVYREALKLVGQGALEITLLGQNVNAYHGISPEGSAWNLARLIRHLAEIPGLQRIRYTTSYPGDMDDDLIAAHGDTEKLMPFLHLPVQSGSDTILKAMNRRHNAEEYLILIEKLRKARHDIQFSSDFIVGFPGETEQDFNATLELVKAVGFAQGYSFKFSPRPGTPAALREDQIPEEVKSERLQRLQVILQAQQQAFNDVCVGQTVPVLFDRRGKRARQVLGKSPWMQSVYIEEGEAAFGRIMEVRLLTASANGMRGMCHPEPQAKDPPPQEILHCVQDDKRGAA